MSEPTAAATTNAEAIAIPQIPAEAGSVQAGTGAQQAANAPQPTGAGSTEGAAAGTTTQAKPYVIYIILYSMYHHVYKIAQKIEEGVRKVPNVEVKMFRVEETLSPEVLKLMHAAPAPDLPVIKAADLPNADGFLFGTPTRYGIMSGPMKAFWDTTGGLWMKGALKNKMGGLFFSTGSQHGGQETTALTFLTTFAHQGIIFVPLGNMEPMTRLDQIVGGSYYGSGTIAGADGSRNPSEIEYEMALTHGEHFATVLSDYMSGVRRRQGVAAPPPAPSTPMTDAAAPVASSADTAAAPTTSAGTTAAGTTATGITTAGTAAPTTATGTTTGAVGGTAAQAPPPATSTTTTTTGRNNPKKRGSILGRMMKKLG